VLAREEYWNYGVMARPPRPETGTGSGGASYLQEESAIIISEKQNLYYSGDMIQVWARGSGKVGQRFIGKTHLDREVNAPKAH